MLNHNSRLTPHGRRLLVDRVHAGQPAAHVAKQMGISRTAAYRWVKRYTDQGPDGLRDRSSRPHSHANATDPDQAAKVLNDRQEHREGPADISWRTGIPERTVSRIIARAGLPRIWEMDPMTGERIRAGRASERRYEREHPGELMHTDVKKLGRIPDGGGWRADPEQSRQNHKTGHGKVGYDYVHVAVDEHSRLAYAEVLPNETGSTSAAFIRRAAAFMTGHGAPVQRVMTDNAWAYTRSKDFARALADLDAKHVRTKPRHPWQNGKAERFNRTLQEGWAYRQPFADNESRTNALKPWLDFYNYQRRHSALGGHPPMSRCQQGNG
ncbi:IS481 family transposase [Arthrobacter sp. AOP36-A1-22]|uniref:IS481 family transposase n=1 Tax=Arthrobacter sp. AOP36-A1-22 TaxID=3457684 RepID=UPI0040341F76